MKLLKNTALTAAIVAVLSISQANADIVVSGKRVTISGTEDFGLFVRTINTFKGKCAKLTNGVLDSKCLLASKVGYAETVKLLATDLKRESFIYTTSANYEAIVAGLATRCSTTSCTFVQADVDYIYNWYHGAKTSPVFVKYDKLGMPYVPVPATSNINYLKALMPAALSMKCSGICSVYQTALYSRFEAWISGIVLQDEVALPMPTVNMVKAVDSFLAIIAPNGRVITGSKLPAGFIAALDPSYKLVQ